MHIISLVCVCSNTRSEMNESTVDFETIAEALKRRSLDVKCTSKGILIKIGSITSFGVLEGILASISQYARTLHTAVFSSESELSVTVTNQTTERQTELLPAHSNGNRSKSKKRERDDLVHEVDADEDRVDATLKKFRDGGVSDDVLSETRRILIKVLALRGPGDERAIQSFGVYNRKLRSSDAEKRLLIAASIHAGVPVRLSALKRCLGDSWGDGILTTETEVDGIGKISLPLTTEGSVSAEFGNRAVTLVTAITVPTTPAT